jgi:hypothetical protein
LRKCFTLSFQPLVLRLSQLNELAGVDIRVARLFNIPDNVWWNLEREGGRCANKEYEILDEGLAEM